MVARNAQHGPAKQLIREGVVEHLHILRIDNQSTSHLKRLQGAHYSFPDLSRFFASPELLSKLSQPDRFFHLLQCSHCMTGRQAATFEGSVRATWTPGASLTTN